MGRALPCPTEQRVNRPPQTLLFTMGTSLEPERMEPKNKANHKSPRADPGVKESRPLPGCPPAPLLHGYLISLSPATSSDWGLPGPMPTVLPLQGAHLVLCSVYLLLSSSIKLLLPTVVPRATESCLSAHPPLLCLWSSDWAPLPSLPRPPPPEPSRGSVLCLHKGVGAVVGLAAHSQGLRIPLAF